MGSPAPVYERLLDDGIRVFTVYPLDSGLLNAHMAQARNQLVGWSRATAFPDGLPDDLTLSDWPVVFDEAVALEGYQVWAGEHIVPGDVVTVITYWRTVRPASAAATTFLHVLNHDGAVVAGYDGFGAPPNRWIGDDVVVQVHRFILPNDLAPGIYPIELGWYERDTGVRWRVQDPGGGQIDRLLLQQALRLGG
jgi:hypothetical protein